MGSRKSLSKNVQPKLGSEIGNRSGKVEKRKNISNGFIVGKEFRKLHGITSV